MNNDRSNVVTLRGEEIELPLADNTAEAAPIYRAASERFREVRWPPPFDKTRHRLALGDARDLNPIAFESVHLVLTSPPGWTLRDYPVSDGQLASWGSILRRIASHMKGSALFQRMGSATGIRFRKPRKRRAASSLWRQGITTIF